jgi:hypothetical protein
MVTQIVSSLKVKKLLSSKLVNGWHCDTKRIYSGQVKAVSYRCVPFIA